MKKALYLFAVLFVIIILLLLSGNKHVSTEIIINAPVDTIWAELTDFNRYPDWNPFVRKVSGTVEKGNTIEVTLQIQGKDPIVLSPEVKLFEKNKIFQWKGRLLFPGIFTGRHTFRLMKIQTNKTKFIQEEEFNGILVPFFNFDSTIASFKLMNEELKKRTENRL